MMIERWNHSVRPTDTVWHLGDFIWGKWGPRAKEIRDRLNGEIFFVRGNHDFKWEHLKRLGLNPLFPTPGDPAVMHVGGRAVVLTHYPPTDYNAANRVLGFLGAGAVWLHGHSHCRGKILDPRVFDVGVDHQQRRPGWRYLDGGVPVGITFGDPLSLDLLLGN